MGDGILGSMKATNILRTPSFLKGMARAVDLFGSLDEYKYTDDPDSELLYRDWMIVGKELEEQVEKYERQPKFATC